VGLVEPLPGDVFLRRLQLPDEFGHLLGSLEALPLEVHGQQRRKQRRTHRRHGPGIPSQTERLQVADASEALVAHLGHGEAADEQLLHAKSRAVVCEAVVLMAGRRRLGEEALALSAPVLGVVPHVQDEFVGV